MRSGGVLVLKADDVEFPKLPGNRAMRVNAPEDLERYSDGYSNPDLIRIHEEHMVDFDAPGKNHSVPYDPYGRKPQFEFKPREYKLYIQGLESFRLTQIHNHDEDSEFWENP